MHSGLMKLLNEGTFELKAREVPTFMQIYSWAKELPSKLEKPKKKPKKKAKKK